MEQASMLKKVRLNSIVNLADHAQYLTFVDMNQ